MNSFVKFVVICLLLMTFLLPFDSQAQNGFVAQQSKNYITLSAGVDELKEQFNKDQGKTRLLMVLSPG